MSYQQIFKLKETNLALCQRRSLVKHYIHHSKQCLNNGCKDHRDVARRLTRDEYEYMSLCTLIKENGIQIQKLRQDYYKSLPIEL